MTAEIPTSDPDARDDGPRGPLVVGVDGSVNAGYAARWAAQEASRRGCALTLVHALHLPWVATPQTEPSDFALRRDAEGRALLESAAEQVRGAHPDVPIQAELSPLEPVDALTTLSREASLLVTGSRGRGGFTGMLLGSVSRQLSVHSHCPLVVVRDEPTAEAAGKVVLGVGRKHSATSIAFAFEAASRQGAELDVVRAYTPRAMAAGIGGISSMYETHPESDALAATEEAQAAIAPCAERHPDVTLHVTAAEGNAVDALTSAAYGASLLVVARHRRRGPLAVGAGYVTDGVLAHSSVPVAVVPGP